MNWPLLAGSLAGVLALAGIAWLLGLGGGAISDADEAMRLAEESLGGFRAECAFVSSDGRAALVIGDGEAALLKQHGTQVAARRLPSVRIEPAEEGVHVESGERMFGDVLLKLPPEERDRLLTLV